MAIVPFKDLVELVQSSPKCFSEWYGSAPADVALAVTFADAGDSVIRTETMETANGGTLVIDLDSSGKVLTIEIN